MSISDITLKEAAATLAREAYGKVDGQFTGLGQDRDNEQHKSGLSTEEKTALSNIGNTLSADDLIRAIELEEALTKVLERVNELKRELAEKAVEISKDLAERGQVRQPVELAIGADLGNKTVGQSLDEPQQTQETGLEKIVDAYKEYEKERGLSKEKGVEQGIEQELTVGSLRPPSTPAVEMDANMKDKGAGRSK